MRPPSISVARLIVSDAAHAAGPSITVRMNGIKASLISHVAEPGKTVTEGRVRPRVIDPDVAVLRVVGIDGDPEGTALAVV